MPNGEDENLTEQERKATFDQGILNEKFEEFWKLKKEKQAESQNNENEEIQFDNMQKEFSEMLQAWENMQASETYIKSNEVDLKTQKK